MRSFGTTYTVGLGATRTLLDAGVEVLAGTDANDSYVFPSSSLHEELVEAGLTPAEALRAATIAGARFLERTDDFGSVEVGKQADLLLLDENPLKDVGHTRSIDTVIFDGRVYERQALDALVDGVAAHVASMHVGIDVPAELLERYVGVYESPLGGVEVGLSKGALWLRFANRGRMALRALSETDFVFLPQDASVRFEVESDGTVSALHFEQGGNGGRARKID